MYDYSARCQACGATLAPDAAYCGSCGSPRMAAPAQPQAQPLASGGAAASALDQQSAPLTPLAPPSALSSPGASAPLPNSYSPPAQLVPPSAGQNPPPPTPYPPVTGPMGGSSGAFAPPPPPSAAPAGSEYGAGQYPPPVGYAPPGQYPSAPGYPQYAQAPQPEYPQPSQLPPSGYPQAGQYPPPAYGAPGYGQPLYVQVQQQPSNAGPVIAEVILGLFGIFGVGWLIGGKTTIGAILLGASALWWIVSIVTVVFTFGFGALCIYPIDIAFIVASAVTLSNTLKRG